MERVTLDAIKALEVWIRHANLSCRSVTVFCSTLEMKKGHEFISFSMYYLFFHFCFVYTALTCVWRYVSASGIVDNCISVEMLCSGLTTTPHLTESCFEVSALPHTVNRHLSTSPSLAPLLTHPLSYFRKLLVLSHTGSCHMSLRTLSRDLSRCVRVHTVH